MDSREETAAQGKILLVEDSEFQSRFYVKLLQREGYEVVAVPTGEDALAQVQTVKPDLVLLDLQLPGVDGFHVCAALRDEAKTHDIPIIILSSKKEVPTVMTGLSKGADDYVGKQEDTGTLVARIGRLIERTRTHRRVSDGERLDLLRQATELLTPGIRKPLSKAFKSVEVLERFEFPDPRHQRARDYLRQYLERVMRLVANIEDVSRIASKSFVARQRVVNVNKALDEAENMARFHHDLDGVQKESKP